MATDAAEPTAVFQLPAGEMTHIGNVTVTAAGGFRGYRKGSDLEGQTYLFVRDGDSEGEYAMIVLDRLDASEAAVQRYQTTRHAFAYVTMGVRASSMVTEGWTSEPMDPERKWTSADGDFFYVTLDGNGGNAGRRITLASATVGVDLIGISLQAPASMWPTAFEALKQFAASIHAVPLNKE
jgi:hypothetical protein